MDGTWPVVVVSDPEEEERRAIAGDCHSPPSSPMLNHGAVFVHKTHRISNSMCPKRDIFNGRRLILFPPPTHTHTPTVPLVEVKAEPGGEGGGERLLLSRCRSELELRNRLQWHHVYHGRRREWRCVCVCFFFFSFDGVEETDRHSGSGRKSRPVRSGGGAGGANMASGWIAVSLAPPKGAGRGGRGGGAGGGVGCCLWGASHLVRIQATRQTSAVLLSVGFYSSARYCIRSINSTYLAMRGDLK